LELSKKFFCQQNIGKSTICLSFCFCKNNLTALSVAVIDETVRATIKFLNASIEKHIGISEVCEFLGWGINRVQSSFARINV